MRFIASKILYFVQNWIPFAKIRAVSSNTLTHIYMEVVILRKSSMIFFVNLGHAPPPYIKNRSLKDTEKKHIFYFFWKCNFPMNHNVCLSVCLSVGLSVQKKLSEFFKCPNFRLMVFSSSSS